MFGDFAEKGFLPSERAEFCHEEYEQVRDAFQALVAPHIDQDLAREIFDRIWLDETLSSRPRQPPSVDPVNPVRPSAAGAVDETPVDPGAGWSGLSDLA